MFCSQSRMFLLFVIPWEGAVYCVFNTKSPAALFCVQHSWIWTFPDRWSLKGRARSGEATEQRQTRWAEDRLKPASYKEHAQILQLTPGAHSIITQRASHTFILTHPVQCASITSTTNPPILNNPKPLRLWQWRLFHFPFPPQKSDEPRLRTPFQYTKWPSSTPVHDGSFLFHLFKSLANINSA